MKALVVFAHPNPKSFNRAVLDTVTAELKKKGAEVRVKDLYATHWNPILAASDFEQLLGGKTPEDIAREQGEVTWADTLFFIYPIWWYSHPAILKGWIDRVFSFGFAYTMTDKGPEGLLKNKTATVITTSGGDRATAEQNGLLASIKATMVNGILGFSGITDVRHRNLFAVPYVDDTARKKMLEEVGKFVAESCES